jgi:hypothetical protein
MDEAGLKSAHRHCSQHKGEILRSKMVGCFYCKRIFESLEIKDWIHPEQTARCPHCGIDSIIGDASGFSIDANFLDEMHQCWFKRGVLVKRSG